MAFAAMPGMDAERDALQALARFVRTSAFAERGAVMTDLDGTAVHEVEGRALLSRSMERGLARVHDAGRQVLVNTLRFPLSVMRAFGPEWHRVTGDDVWLVSMKGSQVGRITACAGGQLAFEEIDAFPLTESEMGEVMEGVRGMRAHGVDDLLVFFYPRDWRRGEQVWVADPARVDAVRDKYRSASHVFAGGVQALDERLRAEPVCMVFLLVDAPQDRLMAYQHTQKSRFVTHAGVDKRHGGEALARHLHVSLADSVGAGDAETDTFLDAVGFAVIVGNQDLAFKGLADTVRVADPAAFGDMLMRLGAALSA
jgi:hydroxymethylpyrimidine pyrophosphatase-like HAD family hydrolase